MLVVPEKAGRKEIKIYGFKKILCIRRHTRSGAYKYDSISCVLGFGIYVRHGLEVV